MRHDNNLQTGKSPFSFGQQKFSEKENTLLKNMKSKINCIHSGCEKEGIEKMGHSLRCWGLSFSKIFEIYKF